MTETSARPAAAIYRGMDRAALDAAYNNSAAVADSADWLARWRELSAAARARALPFRFADRRMCPAATSATNSEAIDGAMMTHSTVR